MEQAIAALEGIQRYGLDTLSGRTDGPDDRGWQRAGVNEMTKRARLGIAPLRAALAEPAPVQEPENHFKSACWLRTSFSIGRYLMSNAHGRWNGAEKALYHRELCKFYVASVRGFDDEGLVDLCGEDFKAVHKSTQQLTDRMDEVIGFPLDSAPDYAKLEPLFFEHFHTLAMQALQVSQQPAPPADVPMLTDEELSAIYKQANGEDVGKAQPLTTQRRR